MGATMIYTSAKQAKESLLAQEGEGFITCYGDAMTMERTKHDKDFISLWVSGHEIILSQDEMRIIAACAIELHKQG